MPQVVADVDTATEVVTVSSDNSENNDINSDDHNQDDIH